MRRIIGPVPFGTIEDVSIYVQAALMSRLPHGLLPVVIWSFTFVIATPARAQFKEVGPPPFSPAIARQKIRTLLEKADPGNPQPAVDALLGLVAWYRDILDQELIAAWQKEERANLTQVIEPLADAAVASAIVEYSWRQAPQATWNLADAPLLGHLMERYPDSAKPFLADLLGPAASGRPAPDLPTPEAQAVCRILVDMPDVGTWRKSALQILPYYRRVAQSLLVQDVHGDDREKSYRAQRWLTELRWDEPVTVSQQPSPRTKPARTPSPATGSAPPPLATVDHRPTLARADSDPLPPKPSPAPVPSPAPSLYNGAHSGATSGTLQCSGGPIPQNAEYVFRNLPPGNMQLDYDTKTWDAHLAPGEGPTQKLILRNKSSSPQKRCVVHWSVSP